MSYFLYEIQLIKNNDKLNMHNIIVIRIKNSAQNCIRLNTLLTNHHFSTIPNIIFSVRSQSAGNVVPPTGFC